MPKIGLKMGCMRPVTFGGMDVLLRRKGGVQMNYNGYNGYYQPQQNTGFTCRAVSSKEEAIAAQTDFFSMGTVMPDLGHGVIYLKRFNPQTGASDFAEFRYAQPEPPTPTQKYVTIEEFESFKNSLRGDKHD